MKHTKLLQWCVLPFAAVLSAAAQVTSPGVQLQTPAQPRLNRIGASFRPAFNASVNFQGVGAFVPPGASRRTPDGDPFNYDDGYVLTDSTGNAMGFTRYWGYDDASQVPGDGTIVMHSSSSAGNSIEANGDDPLLGFEFTYNRELGRNGNLRWGLEAAFNYLNVSVRDSRPLTLGYSRTSTPYQLPPLQGGGFVSPPPPGHRGRFALPVEGDPVINATPLPSSTATAFATMTGERVFDANVFGFRLGPYLELPLGEQWALTFSAGLALAAVTSDFSFSEAVALPNVTPVSGAGSHNDLLIGGYVAANVSYQFAKDWAIFGGAQFQHVGEYSHTVNGRTAALDLSQTVFAVVGVSFSF